MAVETTTAIQFWQQAEERFLGAVGAHCEALHDEPGEWAGLRTLPEAWEELAGSPDREVRREVAFLWLSAPNRLGLVRASRRALDSLVRG